MRSSGLPTVNLLPSGTHIVHFYRHTRQLVETHASFCQAGLKANEFCVWIMTPPLLKAVAELELAILSVDVRQCLANGQLEFVPYAGWYLDEGVFSQQRSVERSQTFMAEAKARGFTGIRVCGDLSWVKTDADWHAFLAYEHAIHQAISGTEILGLCSYPIRTERDSELTELLQSHHAVLRPREESWEYLPLAG